MYVFYATRCISAYLLRTLQPGPNPVVARLQLRWQADALRSGW